MVEFSKDRQIYIYGEATSMRFGIPKIQLLVAANFSKVEIMNSVFLFCSGDRKQIKIYYEDEYGAWLLQNKLYDQKFKLSKELKSGVKLTRTQLRMFLHGLDVIEQKPTSRIIGKNYF